MTGLDVRPVNSSCVAPERPNNSPGARIQRIYENVDFDKPTDFVQSSDGQSFYLAEQRGRILQLPADFDTDMSTVALDLSGKMEFTAEGVSGPGIDSQQWGVISIALGPNFETNGYIYVAYNVKPSENSNVFSYVARFSHVNGVFDPSTEVIVFQLEQSSPLHHFGKIAFGNDGHLYVGSGDGGQGPNVNDITNHRAQDPHSLFGKILRLDVSGGLPYGIPPDNPFANGIDGAPEVFILGIRNPWRFSIDKEDGRLFVGDVGRSKWEEVNIGEPGLNYGWPVIEGNECTVPGCDKSPYQAPYYTYGHDEGDAIVGGYVYRGSAFPDVVGNYLFGDISKFTLWSLAPHPSDTPIRTDFIDGTSSKWTGMSEDNDGELYVFFIRVPNRLYKVVPDPMNEVPSQFPETLSATGCVDPNNPVDTDPGLIPYDVTVPLWSDGAVKKRWMAIPDNSNITIDADGDFIFPAGTVLMKEFSFVGVPHETRLFVRHEDGGWGGYSYEWRPDLSDADYVPDRKTVVLDNGVTWMYPDEGQCFECHTTQKNFSLGPEVLQLNREYTYPDSGIEANQLHTLNVIGMFSAGLPADIQDLPSLDSLTDPGAHPIRLARGYLHANCSGCHLPDGNAQATVDFRFSASLAELNACDAVPTQNDGGIAGARILKPMDPSASMISVRMHDLGSLRMPPLATELVDDAGTDVIDDWINHPDACLSFPDDDNDNVENNVDNCSTVQNAAQTNWNGNAIGDRCEDADLDGITDATELFELMTAPDDEDTDNDGLTDFEEISFDGNGQSYTPGEDTDPNEPDTDGDGILDGADADPLVAAEPAVMQIVPMLPWRFLVALSLIMICTGLRAGIIRR